ncbi:MAG: glycosyltransferase family 39 protein [candidate division Zixibacteria bacterium]|nr:glycosyltransferase family 39 protein [candidate division Zixibacteria bacterium]
MKDFFYRNRFPLIAVGAAILVRLVYLLELSYQPGFSVPMVDEKWHWMWAGEIIDKSFWGESAWFRAPLYPYLLALLRWITGASIFWSKLLQLLLCGGTAFFTYRLGHLFYGRTVGLIAALIYAFYGTLLYYEAMFLIPVLFLFFIMWGMYRLVAYRESESALTWLTTGIVFGLATIARPNILIVIPVLMLWLYLARPIIPNIKLRLLRPLALAVGVGLMILPVTVRNLAVTGEPTLISTQGGVNFYIGNNPVANGLSMKMPEVDLNESLRWSQFIPATMAAAQRETGRQLSEAEASSFWTNKTLQFIADNPGQFLGLTWRKTVYFICGFENSDNFDIYYERGKSWLFSALMWQNGLKFPFGLLLPLVLVGIYVRRKDLSKLAPLYLFVLAYIPTIILFLVTARHRLPLIPILAIIAAAGIAGLIDLIRKRHLQPVWIAGGILIVSLLLVNRLYYEEGGSNDFQIHFNAGIKAENLKNYNTAEEEYLLADSFFPYSAALVTSLGHAQYQLGKLDEAATNYHRALSLSPGFHSALNNLGLLVRDKGQLDSALVLFGIAANNFDSTLGRANELGQVYLNAGETYEEVGNIDSAGLAYIKAVEAAPMMGLAYFQAAAFWARHNQFAMTDSLYARGLRFMDLRASDYFNWGLSLINRQRLSDGIGMMYSALKRDTALYQAYYCIGLSLWQGGFPADSAMPFIDRALDFDSTYQPALSLKTLMQEATKQE